MFEDLEYRHHAKISRDAWYLKLWCWAWWSEPENADFCKLFWGYVFLGPNIFVRIVGFPFWLMFIGVRGIVRHRISKRPPKEIKRETHDEFMARVRKERAEQDARVMRQRERKAAREAKVAAFFGRIGSVADRVVGAFQAGWPVLRWFFYLLTVLLAVALAGALVWGMTELVPLAAHNIGTIGRVVGVGAVAIGGIALIIFIFGSTGYFFTETEKGQETRRKVKSGGATFFHVMYVGLCAVKSRTCPKVELLEENK